jgi:uncharacterized phage infection (PIP) family protein YhgE
LEENEKLVSTNAELQQDVNKLSNNQSGTSSKINSLTLSLQKAEQSLDEVRMEEKDLAK